MQMFLWNNIFLSLGFDVKDHFKDFGGDAAAYAAPVSAIFSIFVFTLLACCNIAHCNSDARKLAYSLVRGSWLLVVRRDV